MRRNCLVPFLSVLVFVLLLAGCWPFKPDTITKPGDPPPQLLPRTTPQNVLYNFKVIYGTMDNSVNTHDDAQSLALTYRELFHPDFKFSFVINQAPPNFPAGWWGRDDEVIAFDSMMVAKADGSVTEIQLNWSPGVAEPDNRVDPDTQLPLHPGWMYIKVASVLLDVTQGEAIQRVPNNTAEFWFAPDPADTTLWVISEWQDWDH